MGLTALLYTAEEIIEELEDKPGEKVSMTKRRGKTKIQKTV